MAMFLNEEQKHTEQRRTLQPQYVVNLIQRDDKHVVRQSREHLHPPSAGVVF